MITRVDHVATFFHNPNQRSVLSFDRSSDPRLNLCNKPYCNTVCHPNERNRPLNSMAGLIGFGNCRTRQILPETSKYVASLGLDDKNVLVFYTWKEIICIPHLRTTSFMVHVIL